MSEWRDIPGYGGRYQISDQGQVRNMFFGDKPRRRPYMKKLSRREDGVMVVNLKGSNGRHRAYTVARLMAITFLGMPDDIRYCAYCKNGMKSDVVLENIGVCTRKDLCKDGNRRRPVRKVCRETGEILAVYRTVREAAAKNYMYEGTMISRLKGRTVRDDDAFIFEYDDEDRRGKGRQRYT